LFNFANLLALGFLLCRALLASFGAIFLVWCNFCCLLLVTAELPVCSWAVSLLVASYPAVAIAGVILDSKQLFCFGEFPVAA